MSPVATAAQIVTFRLGEDLFAADINDVERVLRYTEATPVPNVPDWVQGVIEYRSQVVPVIDLRVRFELAASAPTGMTRLMVLSSDGQWIAAVVDAVLEVVPITATQLAPPPPLFKGLSAAFLRGILRRNDKLIIVLDIARLLAAGDRLAFDRAMLVDLAKPPEAQADPVSSPPSAAVESSSVLAPAPDAASDLLIIRGSLDPAVAGPLHDLLGTSDDASRPDSTTLRGPGLPTTPDWGAPAQAPRTGNPGADDPQGGQSDG